MPRFSANLSNGMMFNEVPFLERFGAGLGDALAPGGRALVVVSSHGGQQRTLDALERGGLVVTPMLVTDHGYEVVTIIEARKRTQAT